MIRQPSTLKAAFQFLWNGGLDPAQADPLALRQRRTFAATIFALLPVVALLLVSNTLTGAAHDNPEVVGVTVCLIALLVIQAVFDCPRLVAHATVVSYWIAIVGIMLDGGLGSMVWAWALGIPLTANVLIGQSAGVVWACVVCVTYWTFALLQTSGYTFTDPTLVEKPIQIALEGSLMLAMFSIAPFAFRAAQNDAEHRLKQTVEELGYEVDVRRQAESAARDAEQAKTAFLAAMSHELRTPLNGLLGAVQIMQDRNSVPEDDRDLLKVMRQSGDLLLDLINNILDLTRLDADSLELETTPVNLHELLTRVVAPFQVQGQDADVIVTADIDPALPVAVLADPTRLRQILLNLLGNACKFTKKGQVILSARPVEAGLEFTVEDTGIGISANALKTLFEPYVQAEAGTAGQYGGSGLGLAIVKRLVEAMGGNIHVESRPNVGSTFTVTLPLQETDQLPDDSPTAYADGGSLSVLVVDDNQVNRMVLKSMLNQLGHSVTEAENGRDAVARVQESHRDLVFMDLSMPVLDGYGAIAEIRGLANDAAQTRIVALTANALEEDRKRVLALGGDDFLTKPLRRDDLLRALAEAQTATRVNLALPGTAG